MQLALEYVKDCRQFGQAIVDFHLIQGMLADSKMGIDAAESVILDVAKRCDAGENVSTLVSCAKYFATEMYCRVADRVVQVFY